MSDELLTRARELLRKYDLESAGELADMLVEMVATHERMAKIVETANSTIANFAVIAEAAEARLRELASAEPVAWVDGENFVWPKGKRSPSNCDALIRRPEMPA